MGSFQFFPILRGLYLNYQQYIALTGSVGLFLIGLILLLVSLCLKGKPLARKLFWIGSALFSLIPVVLQAMH
jgi:hypothetical protein